MRKIYTKELNKIFRQMKQEDRMDICREIWPLLEDHIEKYRLVIPVQIQQACVLIYSRAMNTNKISWRDISKLYCTLESDPRDMRHWCFDGNKMYRKKDYHNSRRSRTHHHKSLRRPSLYGWSGQLLPRSFTDRFMPKWVKTQKDLDHYLEQKHGCTREEYVARLYR